MKRPDCAKQGCDKHLKKEPDMKRPASKNGKAVKESCLDWVKVHMRNRSMGKISKRWKEASQEIA